MVSDDERLLIGPESFDDAGVVRLGQGEGLSADDRLALVQTVDFFPPVVDDPRLFQPGGTDRGTADPRITAENAGATTWLRREHQTLSALPRTGVVLFTIRIFQDALGEVARDAELARRLLGAVRTMDPALQHYKSMPVLRDAVVAYLEAGLRAPSS